MHCAGLCDTRCRDGKSAEVIQAVALETVVQKQSMQVDQAGGTTATGLSVDGPPQQSCLVLSHVLRHQQFLDVGDCCVP